MCLNVDFLRRISCTAMQILGWVWSRRMRWWVPWWDVGWKWCMNDLMGKSTFSMREKFMKMIDFGHLP